jgi:hypothetical protein
VARPTLQVPMLDESYILQYKMEVLKDMSNAKRSIFENSLRKFVITTTQVYDLRVIQFHMYQDHFLEAVARWPWLLCSNLGAHLEPCYKDEDSVTYQTATQWGYKVHPSWKGTFGKQKP